MSKATVYNQEGKKLETIDLNPKIFNVDINESVIHEAIVAQMANARRTYADTKGRGEVRGGGRKPWRQKGTGRARHGSTRSPIWVGGGVTFGPSTERNYKIRINKKTKRKAIFMALSARAKDDDVIVLDELKLEEPKTKKVASIFKSIPGVERKVLVVIDKPNKEIVQASKNIDWAKVIGPNNLNVYDIANYQKILIVKGALPEIEKVYISK